MSRAFLCRLVRLSGIPGLIRATVQSRSVTVLTYHRVDPQTAGRHFAALNRWYRPISLQSYIEARRTGTLHRLPRRSLIVTIDDGHASVYRLKPVLQKHGVPVTVFLCSGFVDSPRRFWFSAPGLDPDERQRLKTVPDDERRAALKNLGFDASVEFGEREALDARQIRELATFVDFQSHSVSHPILPMCSDAKAREEIVSSKHQLETLLGRRVNALAFPNGSYGRRELQLTGEAGYECGLTMDAGLNNAATPALALRRLAMADDCGIDELAVRSCGLWEWIRDRTVVRSRSGRPPHGERVTTDVPLSV